MALKYCSFSTRTPSENDGTVLASTDSQSLTVLNSSLIIWAPSRGCCRNLAAKV